MQPERVRDEKGWYQLCHQVSIEFSAEESISNSRWYIMISHKRNVIVDVSSSGSSFLFVRARKCSFILLFSADLTLSDRLFCSCSVRFSTPCVVKEKYRTLTLLFRAFIKCRKELKSNKIMASEIHRNDYMNIMNKVGNSTKVLRKEKKLAFLALLKKAIF